MNKNVLGWLKIVGAAAAAAGGVIAAPLTAGGSLTLTVGIIAGLTGLSAAGVTASALYQDSPKSDTPAK